jgi:hypothetical protein
VSIGCRAEKETPPLAGDIIRISRVKGFGEVDTAKDAPTGFYLSKQIGGIGTGGKYKRQLELIC